MFARGLTAGHTRTRARREGGAVAVEFALIFPILVMLVAGITTAGLSYTHAIGLTNAVREGARLGATADTTPGSWAADVQSRVRRTQFDDGDTLLTSETAVCVDLLKLSAAKTWVASTKTGTSGCSTNSNTPSLTAGAAPAAPANTANLAAGTCVVRVWAARDFEISLIVVPVWHGTVVRTSVARYERDAC